MTSAFFREQAANCARTAEASDLPNVRERQTKAQQAWLVMADAAEQTELRRAAAARAHAARLARSAAEPPLHGHQ